MEDSKFQLVSDFKPTGDQPQAIESLIEGLEKGNKNQTLLGVTGSGKTFSIANVIQHVQKPTLVISHNKTLAAQLYQEFRDFFPKNAVEYFVSYYDYYQPEAYVPQTDTYIEKETQINEEIDKLRLSSTTSLLTRRDVIVVASVSCIYNIGSPKEYQDAILTAHIGQFTNMDLAMKVLSRMSYTRNDFEFARGMYRRRGDTLDVYPSYTDYFVRIEFLGDQIDRISQIDPMSGDVLDRPKMISVYPAKHYVTPVDRMEQAIREIREDLEIRVEQLKAEGKTMEAYRLNQRTNYDLEIIQEIGYCNGIENYSRYFDGRKPGEAPNSMLEFFPKDYLLVVDESHITIPQIRGMYNGDQARKKTLVDFGFRLPAAMDNRPLKFDEFQRRINQTIFASATPNEYELSLSEQVVEQLIRPTGIIDPEIEIRPSEGQIRNLMNEILIRAEKNEKVLVTTLTKRMSEDLTTFLTEQKVKVAYLHSEVETLDRSDILDDLRRGVYDVVIGVNLLREGLDLPEVSLVAILDADKEGFLRSHTSLVQTMGRAARHINGRVIMYADQETKSMKSAIDEVKRRREVQVAYNLEHGITPVQITKKIREKLIDRIVEDETEATKVNRAEAVYNQAISGELIPQDKTKLIGYLTKKMKEAAKEFRFEEAAVIRDKIAKLDEKKE
ncbi:MAG: excinuclease ABC subunit UvrB [bacterium]|nr:excinuclease ABC subunit UvrB [bacterium]